MTLSVRLDEETRRTLVRLARSERISQSEVVRRAIHRMAAEEAPEKIDLYERIKRHVGVIHGLPPDLSESSGDRFYKIVLAKHRRRQKR